MTDIVALTHRLYKKIKLQKVPETLHWTDQIDYITDGIRHLYVLSGRELQFSEDLFEYDESGHICSFANDLTLAETEWVLLDAQTEFYRFVQASVDDQVSYSTDATSVTHGDKPYEHIGETIDKLEMKKAVVWTRLVRYNQLGVSG